MKKIFVILFILILFSGCGRAVTTMLPINLPTPSPMPVKISFLAAGDNLIHASLYAQAAARTGYKGYDFAPVYANVYKYIEGADNDFLMII